MNKRGIVLAFAFLLFASVLVSGVKISSEVYDYLEEEESVRVFVKIGEGTKNLRSFSTRSLENSKGIKEKLDVIHDFGDVFSVELNKSQLRELENSSEILEILPVREVHAFLDSSVPVVSGDVVWKNQIDGINLTGNGETVCVLDTGVDFTHPALIGKNLTCIIDCAEKECIEECSLGDLHGHGTHVSGIIASQNDTYRGISPGANLIGVRVLNSDGYGSDLFVAKGIYWCINHAEEYNISVISMSLGSVDFFSTNYCDELTGLTDLINLATLNNLSVVVATGNNNSRYPNQISSPACIENSTRVSSISDSRSISSFANRGSFFLDIIFAPGEWIYSTIPGGTINYMHGTSMSTPHVSGAIAILNQYRKLEGLPKLTPTEITNLLVSSGEELYDSSSGGTYTILNVSSLILSADESSPKIVLNNLENNSEVPFGEVSFQFNVSDLQKTNVSFFLWNFSNDLINNTNFSFGGNSFNFNLTFFLEGGSYLFGIYAVDANGNEIYLGNYTLYVESIFLNNFSPQNDFGTRSNYSEFFCNFSSLENELSNVTFYLWNSSGLIYNETRDVSGYSNYSIFNWTFETEEDYLWSCEAENTLGISPLQISNYSFTYDITSPNISSLSPENNSVYTGAQTISFDYYVSDLSLNNCSLYIGDSIVSTDNSSTSGQKSFSYSVSVGTHTWKIGCFDKASNLDFSESRVLTINPVPRSPGGGGSPKIKKDEIKKSVERVLSSTDLQRGIVEYFSSGESANFSIGGESHKLVVNSFSSDSIYLQIFSDPINLFLKFNEAVKVDLNKDNFYDFEIFYSGIVLNKSSLLLKEIHEEISSTKISEEKNVSEEGDVFNEEISKDEISQEPPIRVDRIIIFVLVIFILFFFLVLIFLKLVKAIVFYSNPVNKYISNYEVPRR